VVGGGGGVVGSGGGFGGGRRARPSVERESVSKVVVLPGRGVDNWIKQEPQMMITIYAALSKPIVVVS
jgi:hypothetical protein